MSDEGICNVEILGPEEALFIRAREDFEDRSRGSPILRKAGHRWYVYGPCEYYPPIEVQTPVERRTALLQIEPMGIYMFYSKLSLVLFLVAVFVLVFFTPRVLGMFGRSPLGEL